MVFVCCSFGVRALTPQRKEGKLSLRVSVHPVGWEFVLGSEVMVSRMLARVRVTDHRLLGTTN
jgi:hypothetical protein